jgi:hypothetical protein
VGRPLHTTMRISPDLKEIIQFWRNPGERECDAILRILDEKTEKIKSQAIEIDRLRGRIKELEVRNQPTNQQ